MVAALLSARIPDPDLILADMETAMRVAGGEVVARLLQRRGVSRSKRADGTGRMEQPLTQRTLFGSGKTEELKSLMESTGAEVLLIYNSITSGQRKALAMLAGCQVFSYLDDFDARNGLHSTVAD